MIRYSYLYCISLFLVGGCTPLIKQTDAIDCDPNLASCVQVEERTVALFIDPVPVNKEALLARVAELQRWLAWQRTVALGQTDLPFESRDQLISNAPEAMLNTQLSAEERINSIQLLANTGETTQALLLAKQLMEVEPDRIDNLTLYSALLTREKKYDESISILNSAIEAHPQIPELYNNQAVNYAARGDLGTAITLLQTAFSTHPSFAQIQFNLKQLYQATARRALSPLEEPRPPELKPIELHFQNPITVQISAEKEGIAE